MRVAQVHGSVSSATSSVLRLSTNFWKSRQLVGAVDLDDEQLALDDVGCRR